MDEQKNKSFLREMWEYFKIRKNWFLVPIIILLLIFALIVIVGQSSSVSTFIYALG